jgi:hypothetical protein
MNDTPETDALRKSIDNGADSEAEMTLFAKKLERERDTLVQKLDAWQEIAKHLHHFVQYPAYGVDQAIKRMDVLSAYNYLKK